MILDKMTHATALAATLALAGCASAGSGGSTAQAPERVSVACTISTLCSLVAGVGGADVSIIDIVPVGVSPETYEPTPSDVVAISKAEVLVENGSGLELWMQKLLADADDKGLVTVVLSDGIPASDRATGNPHLWLDPAYASIYVDEIDAALSHADPPHAASYRSRAAAEKLKIVALDRWIRNEIATIPRERRAMICFHDAWYYFDRRYGIRDVGAIEQSPGQEPSPGYFARLSSQARLYHVNAVFGEPQFSPKLADALASNAGLAIVSQLYDDTLGSTPALSTYDGMMRYDVRTIAEALSR